MKQIALKRLEVENFMMYPHATYDFSDKTIISGQNGKGKSSIVNAYMWLLFDCDFRLKSNPDVRHEVDGEPVKDADVSVQAVLDMDGKEITIKKVQRRKYGKDGLSYKDDNSYFINDVPKTLKAYKEYFEEDMKVLLMCSNINAFLENSNADMRKFLNSAVEDCKDVDIALASEELRELAPLLENYTVEELTAMNRKAKADIEHELPLLDGRIKEKEFDVAKKQDIDVAELEMLRRSLQEQLAANRKAQDDNTEIYNQMIEKSDAFMDLKFKLSTLERTANSKVIAERAAFSKKVDEKRAEVAEIADSISRATRAITIRKQDIDSLEREKIVWAKRWKDVDAERLDENRTVCPTCHRPLPDEEIESIRANFEDNKKARLGNIVEKGTNIKRDIDRLAAEIPTLEGLITEYNAKKMVLEVELADLERQFNEMPTCVNVSELQEHKDLEKQIADAEKAMADSNSAKDIRAQLKIEERDISARLSDCENKIASSDSTADEERLAKLRKDRLTAEQKKTDAEKILYLLKELEKAKATAISNAVNRYFNLVEWQLFDTAKNGEYKSTCVPMVNGRSILTTKSNKGNQILGRIDICLGIQKMTGINVPIWVDDCESLDAENQRKVASMVGGQLVMLAVTNEEKLSVSTL